MKIRNISKDTRLAEQAILADSPFARMKGLLGRKGLARTEALILRPCNSIHTFFMRFPIDALFVDRENRVVKMYSGLGPWRLSAISPKAACCIELSAGSIQETHTAVGDELSFC